MNWGTRISIVFILFTLLILTMVFKASQHSVDLVVPNYYEQELKYDQHQEGMQNLIKNEKELFINHSETTYEFAFDIAHGNPEGKILFFKPDNSNLDKEFEISVNSEGKQTIDTQSLVRGTYVIKVQWETSGKKFYKEQRISI